MPNSHVLPFLTHPLPLYNLRKTSIALNISKLSFVVAIKSIHSVMKFDIDVRSVSVLSIYYWTMTITTHISMVN